MSACRCDGFSLLLLSFASAAAAGRWKRATRRSPKMRSNMPRSSGSLRRSACGGSRRSRRASPPPTRSLANSPTAWRAFRSSIAGIRIVVLLTGSEPVADRTAAGVPIVFRTGAKATHAEAVAAMRRHLIDFGSELPGARGAGYDQRTGEVVLLVTPADATELWRRRDPRPRRTGRRRAGPGGDQRADRIEHERRRRRACRRAQRDHQSPQPLHERHSW